MKEIEKKAVDWNPRAEEVLKDQRAAYDELREKCPVAYSEMLGWSLFRHEDVLRVLLDHKTFSNAVSQHLSVPNGMDAPEHTVYRRMIEPYFSRERVDAFEPVCRRIASELLDGLVGSGEVEIINKVARPFAVGVQCAFLGWPEKLQESLVRWTRKNHEATLAQDRKLMSEIALEFEGMIDDLLEIRIENEGEVDEDLTASLMKETVWRRPLSNEEIASILRNWTVGEIGTITASVGILVEFLARDARLLEKLRETPPLIPEAIEEILRIHGPLVSNRRVARKDVEIGGRQIKAGERVTVMWMAANRDERVFENPDEFRFGRDQEKNLLWGAGIHVCPGAPLARMELRVFVEELLARVGILELSDEAQVELAMYPASGYSVLPVRMG